MIEPTLAQAIEQFARLTQALPDAALDRPWAWRAYDSEGVRFAFFRTYEELRELAAATAADRAANGPARTAAQRVLAQYHTAYRDLWAVVLGADDTLDRAPAEDEWPLRKVLEHVIDAERGFFAITSYALDLKRNPDGRPPKMTEELWEAFWGADDDANLEAPMRGSLADIRAYHDALHERILRELARIGDDEIETPSMFWEGYAMPLRFRLHRFDSHMRQHTIQAEKTLDAIGRRPNEARWLLRLLYAALAEAEGAAIDAEEFGAEQRRATAAGIAARADEIAGIVTQ